MTLMVRGHARPADPGFDAAALAAIAEGRLRPFLRAHPGEGIVTPFARKPVWPFEHATVHTDAAPGAGSGDHPDHHAGSGSRSIGSLGQNKTIRVIGERHP